MIRSASGRPLRFYVMLLTGWFMLRLFGPDIMAPTPPALVPPPTALPISTPASAVAPPALLAASALATLHPAPPTTSPFRRRAAPQSSTAEHAPIFSSPKPNLEEEIAVNLMKFIFSVTDFANDHDASNADYIGGLHMPTASPPPFLPQVAKNRWHASSWLLWRAGTSTTSKAVPAGQLGGSQAGMRLDYDLAPHSSSRITAYGRATRALAHPAAPEAALGLSAQPVRALPVSLAAERRIARGTGGRDANAIMAVGGLGPHAITPSVNAEAYIQTGIVGFRQRDAFIDGKFSLMTPLPATPISLGAAVSGGAQPGVSRLDIGPQLQVRLPLPQVNTRLSIEWRERIAGDARPESGLAITLAADF